MARRARIRGGTLVALAALAGCLFPLQASAQDNSGLASQVLLTQADLPSSYSPGQGAQDNVPYPNSCTGGNALAASLGSIPGSSFADQSQLPLINGIGSDAVVGDNISDAEAAFKVVSTQTFWNCAFAASDSQGNATQSNSSLSQLPDPSVGDQSSEVALSFTSTASDGSMAGYSIDIVSVRVGHFMGRVAFESVESGATQSPGLQIPAALRTQLINLFVSRMRTAEAQIPGGSTTSTPSTSPSSTSASGSCPDVAFYGVRGSAQAKLSSESYMGPEVNDLASEIQKRLPSSVTFKKFGVPYPAVDPEWAADNLVHHDLSPYNVSVRDGVDLLVSPHNASDYVSPVSLAKECPRTALVLAGISQGAQVITTALGFAPANSPLRRHLTAAILLASPIRIVGQPINVGAQDKDGVLSTVLFPQPLGKSWSVPTNLYTRTRSYCLQDDPICDNTNPLELITGLTKIHAGESDQLNSYGKTLFILQAADFAINQIWKTLGRPRPAQPAFLPAPQTYIALGDSYASGEGTNIYFPDSQAIGDSCHRSPLSDSSLLGVMKPMFVACSGATTDLMQTTNTDNNEPPQVNALSPSDDLVTVSAGGDNLKFSRVLQACIYIPIVDESSDQSCSGEINQNSAPSVLAQFRVAMGKFLLTVSQDAPSARIMLIGYPQLFPNGGSNDACSGVHQNWQVWINAAEVKLNRVLQQIASDSPHTEFVDESSAFYQHEVCGNPSGNDAYVNPLNTGTLGVGCIGGNGSSSGVICSESFHPTVSGYFVLRNRIFDQLDNDLLHHRPPNPVSAPTAAPTKTKVSLGGYQYSVTPTAPTFVPTITISAGAGQQLDAPPGQGFVVQTLTIKNLLSDRPEPLNPFDDSQDHATDLEYVIDQSSPWAGVGSYGCGEYGLSASQCIVGELHVVADSENSSGLYNPSLQIAPDSSAKVEVGFGPVPTNLPIGQVSLDAGPPFTQSPPTQVWP